MRKHLISAALMLAVLASGVTAKVTRHARADIYWSPSDVTVAIPRTWHPEVNTEIHGKRVTFTRHVGFDTEDLCIDFTRTIAWKVERETIALQILREDEDADWVGELACVEHAAPARRV